VKKFLATLFLAAVIGSSVAASVAPASIVHPGNCGELCRVG
jgi:hypothetical protein